MISLIFVPGSFRYESILETEANHLNRPDRDKAVDPARASHSILQRQIRQGLLNMHTTKLFTIKNS